MVGFEALCEGGAEVIRVEPLAKRLGVTKGSFYHHFSTRRDLQMALLQAWEQRGTDEIIEHVQGSAQLPEDRLRSLAYQTFAVQANADAIEAAIRAWANTDNEVAETATRVDQRRLDYVAKLLVAHGMAAEVAQRRAKLLYRTLIGEYIWRSGGGPTSTREEIDELIDLLLN